MSHLFLRGGFSVPAVGSRLLSLRSQHPPGFCNLKRTYSTTGSEHTGGETYPDKREGQDAILEAVQRGATKQHPETNSEEHASGSFHKSVPGNHVSGEPSGSGLPKHRYASNKERMNLEGGTKYYDPAAGQIADYENTAPSPGDAAREVVQKLREMASDVKKAAKETLGTGEEV